MRKDLTELVFIIDRSGSMSGLESDTIGGFNSMIRKQKQAEGLSLIHIFVYFWNRGKNGGRKSFTYDEIDKTLQIPIKNGVFLHFLEQLQLDLLRHADESNGNGT